MAFILFVIHIGLDVLRSSLSFHSFSRVSTLLEVPWLAATSAFSFPEAATVLKGSDARLRQM